MYVTAYSSTFKEVTDNVVCRDNNYPTPRVKPKDKGGYFVFTVNEVAYHFAISYGMYMKQNMQPPVSI